MKFEDFPLASGYVALTLTCTSSNQSFNFGGSYRALSSWMLTMSTVLRISDGVRQGSKPRSASENSPRRAGS